MMAENGEEVRKHARVYFTVFGGLALLTVLTVAVASLELAVGLALGVALSIAVLKGSLVASFFMHLASERRLIILILMLTVVFFFALIFLPLSDSLTNVGAKDVP
ncbi:MAG: cytochrome C oxidase subunit IV family protein [Candidatus Neomarinimicrobiota bacterium]